MMKDIEIVKKALADYKENELIFASILYKEKLYSDISEASYYKILQRLSESGNLVKIAKGIYHLPKISKYGLVPPSESDIVATFTDENKGVVVGYALYNNLNLTTQIPKTIKVLSSYLEGFSKTINNVTVNQVQLEFSAGTKTIVEGLDVLQNFDSIQDINYGAFIKYSKKLASSFDNDLFERIISVKNYKKSTISFFREILDFYNIKNNLSKYLSSLSVYKHPKMEEIYEAARVSR